MRKIFWAIVVLLALFLPVVQAQQLQVVQGVEVTLDKPLGGSMALAQNGNQGLLTTCQLDTLAYGLNKASTLKVINLNASTSAMALGQYYDAPQPIFIPGIRFYAYKLNAVGGTTINLVVELYQARPDSLPLGMPLRSTTVTVDTAFGNGALSALEVRANFFIPTTVMSGGYVVVIRNSSPNPVGIIVNDYEVADGAGEWLACGQFNGTWRHPYQMLVGGYNFNCDLLADPVVGYQLGANFESTPSCLPGPIQAQFTNTSSPVLFHRMYNVAAFMGLGGKSVSWNFGDGSSTLRLNTEYDTTHYYSTAGNYAVTLIDSIYGWSRICTSDTSITLGANPLANFGSISNNFTVWFHDSTANNPLTWHWTFGDGSDSWSQHPSHTYAQGGAYTVCLTTTSNCGMDSVCKTVWVSCAPPVAAFGTSSNGLSISFNDLTTGGATSWVWSFGDGDSAFVQNPVHQYSTPGNYWVCLRSSSSCGLDSSWVWVNVSCAAPVSDFAVSTSNLSASFLDLSANAPTSWRWSFGDGDTATVQHPAHVYPQSGLYEVCLVTASICGRDTTCRQVEVIFVGTDDLHQLGSLGLSPNPAGQRTQVSFELPEAGPATVSLYDMMGRIVLRADLGIVQSENITLDLGSLLPGSYIVRVETEQLALQKKLQVLR